MLHDNDKKHINYSLGHAVSWLYQIANAVNYLHSYNPRPIIHRDLKPLKCVFDSIYLFYIFIYSTISSLLLMQGGKIIKICDFGTMCDIRTIMTDGRGTPLYIAPEVFAGSLV